ncbi:MAG TPA: response regulator [Caulobacteraceae bacterium]|nr:response regulator [Caulobacteraceae bacterium]
MIVEDEVLVAMDLESSLCDAGHEVVGAAADAEAAYELARERPEIAFVDVNLRDGDTGPDIARRLAHEHGVRVVFLTANPTSVIGRSTGAFGVLSKPFEAAAVSRVIETVLDDALPEPPAPDNDFRVFSMTDLCSRLHA